jgi:hypothetical protein
VFIEYDADARVVELADAAPDKSHLRFSFGVVYLLSF